MELLNLKNVFSIFGAFLVFDEDIKPRIEQQYSNCTINIQPEPNNPANRSGKLMRIINAEDQTCITLRPNRIDIEFPRIAKTLLSKVLERLNTILSDLSWILESPLGNRIAYRGDFCIFDDQAEYMKKIAQNLNFVPTFTNTTELSLRLNTPEVIQNETMNVVTNINNAIIGLKKEQQEFKRKALVVTLDINTIASITENRFDFTTLLPYYEEMVNNAFERMEQFN